MNSTKVIVIVAAFIVCGLIAGAAQIELRTNGGALFPGEVNSTSYFKGSNFSCNNCLAAYQIEDLYAFVAGDTFSGDVAMGNNDITGIKDLNTTEVHATSLYTTKIAQNTNITQKNLTDVECIRFQSGGKICTA